MKTKRKILNIKTIVENQIKNNYRKNRIEYRGWGPKIELTLGYAWNVNK